MDPAAVTPQSFDLLSIFLNSDWVVKLVMIGLGAASLWSWTIILDKLFRFAALNREANRFEDAVASGRSLEDVAAEAGERPTHPLPRMLQGAMKEWRETRAKGAVSEGQMAFLIQRIDRHLDATIARESARVENGLGVLAIVATPWVTQMFFLLVDLLAAATNGIETVLASPIAWLAGGALAFAFLPVVYLWRTWQD